MKQPVKCVSVATLTVQTLFVDVSYFPIYRQALIRSRHLRENAGCIPKEVRAPDVCVSLFRK